MSRKFKCHSDTKRITGTLHEDVCALMAIPRGIIHRMKNILNESCRENQNTYFMLNYIFFFKNRVVYEIMSKNMVEPERPQMAISRRVACWICKAIRAQAHASACVPTRTHPPPPPHTHRNM
jgi:hypothetical protein